MTKLFVENMKGVVFENFRSYHNMRRSRKFCQRGSNFDNVFFFYCFFFLVDEVREDPNITISRPSLACQRNTIEIAFRWRANDGPKLNAGLVALRFFRGSRPVLLRNSIFL